MPDAEKSATLRVVEAKEKDKQKGVARIDPVIMRECDLNKGDVIQIENYVKMSKTAAILCLSYPEDEGSGIIRIDGSIRDNIKVAINERVQVRKIKAQQAEVMELAPIQSRLVVRNEQYFSQLLENRVVTQGDIVSFKFMGSRIELVVTNFRPKADAVIITLKTKVQVSREQVPEDIKWQARRRLAYEDIGGLQREIQQLRELIEFPLRYPELYARVGISLPCGILLYGPTGTGKTFLARTVADQTDANCVTLSGPEILSKFRGNSEENLRKIFKKAQEKAPSIIIIDELDTIARKREDLSIENARIVAQLADSLDDLHDTRSRVVAIGTTSRLDLIDLSLRRFGRFEVEIEFPSPSREGRLEILHIQTQGVPLAPDVNLDAIANQTEGLVGATLAALVCDAARYAASQALHNIKLDEPVPPENYAKMNLNQADLLAALNKFKTRVYEPEKIRT